MNGPYVQGLMCRPRVSEQSVKRKYGGQGRRMGGMGRSNPEEKHWAAICREDPLALKDGRCMRAWHLIHLVISVPGFQSRNTRAIPIWGNTLALKFRSTPNEIRVHTLSSWM